MVPHHGMIPGGEFEYEEEIQGAGTQKKRSNLSVVSIF